MTFRTKVATTVALAALLVPAAAIAQQAGSTGMAQYQAGYGSSRYSTSQAQTGSTRDENGNRLVVNGLIQTGASSYSSQTGGVGYGTQGSTAQGQYGQSTAIGNNLNVVVQGSHNTVVVNSNQVNNGNVTAGNDLNGTLRFP